jgi:hypothetical protein
MTGRLTSVKRAVPVWAPTLASMAFIVVCGVVLAWSPWLIGALAAAFLVVVIALVLAGRRRRLGVPRGLAVISMAVLAVVAALVMFVQWNAPDRHHARDVQAVTDKAHRLAELLTTVSPDSRAGYIDRLRPLIVDGAADELKTQVLDQMPEGLTQTGKVRAVGVQAVEDNASSAVVVVEPAPPPATLPGADPGETRDIVLWFLLVRQNGDWKLKNMAPMFP